MCGIVGGIAQRNITPILIEGLKRLEYRGYDSAGVAVIDTKHQFGRVRTVGKVKELESELRKQALSGTIGIAHTRWATHGAPSARNAHPHISGDAVAIVHNGIIENHADLRRQQTALGYDFTSDTDTEVIAHQLFEHLHIGADLCHAVQQTIKMLHGAFALGVIHRSDPKRLVATRRGSPLVIGVGDNEHFIASDVFALLPVTKRFIYLEEGDIADIRQDRLTIYDVHGNPVQREIVVSGVANDAADKAGYAHYMLKEIFTQPKAAADTLAARTANGRIVEEAFGRRAHEVFPRVRGVHIVACGTSYHAGQVARYWIEELANLPCTVEVASEFRYRRTVVPKDTLFVAVSQSGETADTLAALRQARQSGYLATLAVCNVPESSLTREAELVFLTRAGTEIGVASTKAFTTQLIGLLLLTGLLARHNGFDPVQEAKLVATLESLPGHLNQALELNDKIRAVASHFVPAHHTLFLGRGSLYPVALEGALKLKEISYIHAEGYSAGELKHGPLALVDENMPVVAIAANNSLLEKLQSNLAEVRARGGQLHVFATPDSGFVPSAGINVIETAPVADMLAPIVYTVPLQLLSYHVAVQRGTDVDQPRNLAKSVTVE